MNILGESNGLVEIYLMMVYFTFKFGKMDFAHELQVSHFDIFHILRLILIGEDKVSKFLMLQKLCIFTIPLLFELLIAINFFCHNFIFCHVYALSIFTFTRSLDFKICNMSTHSFVFL